MNDVVVARIDLKHVVRLILLSETYQRKARPLEPGVDVALIHSDNILQGQFDEREIARLARQFNVDAIALVKVNELRAHSPMRASITMAIVNSNESMVTFAVDGTWDTTRPATQSEFRRYVCDSCNLPSNSNESQSIYLQSPTRFLAFIASQITNALNGNASY